MSAELSRDQRSRIEQATEEACEAGVALEDIVDVVESAYADYQTDQRAAGAREPKE